MEGAAIAAANPWFECWCVDRSLAKPWRLVLAPKFVWPHVVNHVMGFLNGKLNVHDPMWERKWRQVPSVKFPFEWQLAITELWVDWSHFENMMDVNKLLDYLPNVRNLTFTGTSGVISMRNVDIVTNMISRLPLHDISAPFRDNGVRSLVRMSLDAVQRRPNKHFVFKAGEEYWRNQEELSWFDESQPHSWIRKFWLWPPIQNGVMEQAMWELKETGAHMNKRVVALFSRGFHQFMFQPPVPYGHPYPQIFKNSRATRWCGRV